MRKALIVGIDDYSFSPLKGCINDANRIANILSKDYDDTPNFHNKKLTSDEVEITTPMLRENIHELLRYPCEVALFYFSGHGSEKKGASDACLVTQDAQVYTEGVSLEYLLNQANESKAKEVVIILDCCFSGKIGETSFFKDMSILKEGVSILTSSHRDQVSIGNELGGVFTSIVCDALEGGAVDTIGQVTVASVYSFADKLLGPWHQRPIFKTFVSKMIPLRKAKPQIPIEVLRKLPKYFKMPDDLFQLDPSFEPDAEPRGHENEKLFADLQKYNRVALLVPHDEEHMYWAAVRNKACHLTPLGKYYWKLSKDGMI